MSRPRSSAPRPALALVSFLVLLLCALALRPAAAADELRLAHFMSPKHPMHTALFEPLATDLAAATGGELTIRIYPAGELGKGPKEQFKRAASGVADITFGLHGYTSSQFPRTLLVELPGLASNPGEATEMMWNAFNPYLVGEYARAKALGLWTNAAAVIITRDKPVRTLADLKGMKVRVPSALAGKLVAAWGAVPVPMPVPKVYNALNTGLVDGVLIGPSAIGSFKLHEAGNYVTTGLPSAFAGFYLVMNRDKWNRLSADRKAAVEKVTGRAMSLRAAEAYKKAGERGLKIFGEKKKIVALSPAEAKPFADAAAGVVKAVVAEHEAKGMPASAILKAMQTGS